MTEDSCPCRITRRNPGNGRYAPVSSDSVTDTSLPLRFVQHRFAESVSKISMRSVLSPLLLCLTLLVGSSVSQTPSENYQRGTIVAVVRHAGAGDPKPGEAQYDVSVRVGDTVYVCLYSPPNGANLVEYSAGADLLVSVKETTLTFPSKLTGTTTVPIIRKETAPAKPVLDWSKAPGQYFEMKMQNLTSALDLSAEQQKRIKPILEQEASTAGEVCFNPAIPRKEWLGRWRRVVESSDRQMKPMLTESQWAKLQDMRQDQRKELKQLIEEDSARSTK